MLLSLDGSSSADNSQTGYDMKPSPASLSLFAPHRSMDSGYCSPLMQPLKLEPNSSTTSSPEQAISPPPPASAASLPPTGGQLITLAPISSVMEPAAASASSSSEEQQQQQDLLKVKDEKAGAASASGSNSAALQSVSSTKLSYSSKRSHAAMSVLPSLNNEVMQQVRRDVDRPLTKSVFFFHLPIVRQTDRLPCPSARPSNVANWAV